MKDCVQAVKACLSAFLMNIAGYGFQQAHARMAEGHRKAFLLAALCVVTLALAGGTGHRWTVGRFVTSHA